MLNIKKIKNIHYDLYKNAIFYKNFSRTAKLHKHNNNYNLISSSSSIINHPEIEDRFIVIVRYVNYLFDKYGTCTNLNSNIISFNRILVLDKEFNVIKKYFLETPYQNCPYVGIEDVRFFVHNQNIYYTGSYFYEPENRVKIVSGIYRMDDKTLIPNVITPSFPTNNHWEKNWIFFNNNGELNVIYKWKPIYICKINYETKQLDLLRTIDKVPDFFDLFRGSTNGVEYNNKIWFIVHYSKKVMSKNYYLHVFIVFDKQMNLLGFSNPFKFKKSIIEYCIGMTINNKTNNFIITYSLLDNSSNLMVLSPSFINSMIKYI